MKQIIANLLSALAVLLGGIGFLFAVHSDRDGALVSIGLSFLALGLAALIGRMKGQNRSLSR